MTWQLQEAKNKLSEVVNKAVQDGPQTITLRGRPTAMVISIDEYRRLTQPRSSLVDFLRQSPLSEVELTLARSPEIGRNIEL